VNLRHKESVSKARQQDRQPLCEESEFDKHQWDNKVFVVLGHKPGATSKNDEVRTTPRRWQPVKQMVFSLNAPNI